MRRAKALFMWRVTLGLTRYGWNFSVIFYGIIPSNPPVCRGGVRKRRSHLEIPLTGTCDVMRVKRSLNCQFHHRMNFPCSVALKIGSPVFMVCRSVADVEKRLADHCDNQWLAPAIGLDATSGILRRGQESSFANFNTQCRPFLNALGWLLSIHVVSTDSRRRK
jgi:hypothetical protein